jgi:hypothetical protein
LITRTQRASICSTTPSLFEKFFMLMNNHMNKKGFANVVLIVLVVVLLGVAGYFALNNRSSTSTPLPPPVNEQPASTPSQTQPMPNNNPPVINAWGIAQEVAGTLKNQIDSFSLTITLSPVAQGQIDYHFGLRSLFLYTSPLMLIEPHAFWPDGTPISADARITNDEASAIIDLFVGNGLLARAERYYSESTTIDSAFPPPINAQPYAQRAPERPDSHYSIKVVVSDGHWYTYYETVSNWDTHMIETLENVRRLLSGNASEKIDLLLDSARIGR